MSGRPMRDYSELQRARAILAKARAHLTGMDDVVERIAAIGDPVALHWAKEQRDIWAAGVDKMAAAVESLHPLN